jgi:hypothetical protein
MISFPCAARHHIGEPKPTARGTWPRRLVGDVYTPIEMPASAFSGAQ